MSEVGATAPLGILGGTFDPVHKGHLQLAADACKKLELGQILWIPSANPPHRDQPGTPAAQRLAMVALAIRRQTQFVLDDCEVRRNEPSYTVVTLEDLRSRHGNQRPLVLLLGIDAFLGLHTWHRWRELFSLAHIAVATRPGFSLQADDMAPELHVEFEKRLDPAVKTLATQAAGSIVPFAITPVDVSASDVRHRLSKGEKVANLLPDAVLDYIAANHLYAQN
ncbi:MAG: nicotinate-nucleotide adenylyltransferase [Verrucomicrobia bacterium]|nr:MAG: nicotinate-nucleotide adenylyltransferase [Verrucomicrobiota bacterium]